MCGLYFEYHHSRIANAETAQVRDVTTVLEAIKAHFTHTLKDAYRNSGKELANGTSVYCSRGQTDCIIQK